MPSLKHESLVMLFRKRPSLAANLLRRVLGVQTPRYSRARVASAKLTAVTPTEYDTDLVVLLCKRTPVFGIVVEVQLTRDARKRFTWPYYAMALRARKRCPTCVLVVTPHRQVAQWAATPIATGQPGTTFAPLVMGPDGVPWVTDFSEARKAPELAVLSVQAHGQEKGGLAIAVAAIVAAHGLDDAKATLYTDLVFASLSDNTRRALEEYMRSGNHAYQSDFARKYFGQGKAEGKAEGEAKGKAEALLKIFARRGLRVTKAQRALIVRTTDLALLDRWIDRALEVDSATDVFE